MRYINVIVMQYKAMLDFYISSIGHRYAEVNGENLDAAFQQSF